MKNFFERHYKKIIFLTLLFVALVSFSNAQNDSAIFDETAHIPAGYSYVSQSDMRLNPEHPPLLKDFSGLMLLPMNLKFDTHAQFWTDDINGQWDAGRNLLWQEGNDADKIIFWSRVPFVILSLILGLFIFFWTRELAGLSAGLFALLLYAFDPNMLGHNHFVTTDLGIAAFMVFSFYFFLRFIKNPSWKNVILGGIFLGLVQTVKFSSITLFPIFGLVLLVYPLTKIKRDETTDWKFRLEKLGEYLGKGIVAFLISIFIVWLIYIPNTYRMPEQKLTETIEFYFPHNDPSPNARAVNKISNFLNDQDATRGLSEYFLGIAMVFKRVDGGNGAYFMQEVSGKAFSAYFPTVFMIKEPLASLSLMLLALILTLSRGVKLFYRRLSFHFGETEKKEKSDLWTISSFIRHHITGLSLFAFIFLYSYISVTGNLNIGFRHLFPILPFIYILTAKVLFDFLKRVNAHAKIFWRWAFFVLAFFLVAETILVYPSYMSYFNQIAGGPRNGYRYVTDSNADWGQDLKRLTAWIEDYNAHKDGEWCELAKYNYTGNCEPIEKIHINYFGGGDIYYYLGDIAIDWWDSRRPIEPGWYAISTNYLQGSIYDKTKPDNESYRWLQNKKPLYQVGTSIFIYHLTPEEAGKVK